MKSKPSFSESERTGGEKAAKKSPYERPAITWEESFDKEAALAAACGKTFASQGGACATAPGGS
ncbi:MAG: hypothetical protein ACC645_15950 [Pirellulales bacterium]